MREQLTFATTRVGLLIDPYDTSYTMLRERLNGLTDAEYFGSCATCGNGEEMMVIAAVCYTMDSCRGHRVA